MIDKQAVFSEWNDPAWFANVFKDLSPRVWVVFSYRRKNP